MKKVGHDTAMLVSAARVMCRRGKDETKRLSGFASAFLFEVYSYFTGGIPKSLQIFFASWSAISLWRGTVEILFASGFQKTL
jgi:hypothetical protein